MPDQDDSPKKILDSAQQLAAQKLAEGAAKAAAREVAEGATKAAHGALDAIERMLFGKTGGAEEAIQKFEKGDSLESLRAQYGLKQDAKEAPKEAPKPPEEDPVARAKAQLEALKKARAAGTPTPPPVKKTL